MRSLAACIGRSAAGLSMPILNEQSRRWAPVLIALSGLVALAASAEPTAEQAAEAAGTQPPAATAAPPIETSARPPRLLLLPYGGSDDVGGDMGETILDDLGIETEGHSIPASGEWVAAPIPFRSGLLGWGLKFGVAKLTPARSTSDQPRINIAGIGGMYAEGGSWGAAAGDRRYWGGGKWRTTVGFGTGEIDYEIRLSQEFEQLTLPVRQQLNGGLLNVSYNFAEHAWIGGGISYGRSPISIPLLPPEIAELLPKVTFEMASVRLKGEWDTRDDTFYPRRGSLSELSVDYTHSDSVLDTTRFFNYRFEYNGYRAIDERNVLAWRGAGQVVDGDAPFFALAWFGSGADLRGYTPGRYIGKSLVAVQAEWRWQATRRLGFVAFGGTGRISNPVLGFEAPGWLPAGGIGLRWRLTEENRLNFRIDYGRGRDDETLIVSVGEAF